MFSKGQVHYSQSEHVTGSVQVDITVHFGSKGDLNATKACLLTREKDEKGVGIFVCVSPFQEGELTLASDKMGGDRFKERGRNTAL
jgi:hypothetical protein